MCCTLDGVCFQRYIFFFFSYKESHYYSSQSHPSDQILTQNAVSPGDLRVCLGQTAVRGGVAITVATDPHPR